MFVFLTNLANLSLRTVSKVITLERWQSKTLILSTNANKKMLETEFLIAICRSPGDKWQSKKTVSSDF